MHFSPVHVQLHDVFANWVNKLILSNVENVSVYISSNTKCVPVGIRSTTLGDKLKHMLLKYNFRTGFQVGDHSSMCENYLLAQLVHFV